MDVHTVANAAKYVSVASHRHRGKIFFQVETQNKRSQGTSVQQNSMHYLPRGWGGGGGLRTMTLKIICSKSNSITFYRSLGMRNQVETQKELNYLRFLKIHFSFKFNYSMN